MVFGQDRPQTAPISGEKFNTLISAQNLPLQRILEGIFEGDDGRFVTGPLNPLFRGNREANEIFHSVRVVCPDHQSLNDALDKIYKDSSLIVLNIERCLTADCDGRPMGYRGAFVKFINDESEYLAQFVSIQHIRWMIWAASWLGSNDPNVPKEKLERFGQAISDHLFAVDRKWDFIPEPHAHAYGLSAGYSLYREPPRKVIIDGNELKKLFRSHAGIYNEFAKGILSFTPTDSMLKVLINNAPRKAYPNKEIPLMQHECLEFFERQGDLKQVRTLTKNVFDNLDAGEYFFAVNAAGKIRFARHYSEHDIKLIETKIGDKPVLPNEAFLFPGEPVITAGVFTVEHDSIAHLARVNVNSPKFFYSNITPTVRDDIAVKSNEYILSLGYFFKALNKAGISYQDIVISKF